MELQCDLQCQLVVYGSEQISIMTDFLWAGFPLTWLRVDSDCWWVVECIDGKGLACSWIRFISSTVAIWNKCVLEYK